MITDRGPATERGPQTGQIYETSGDPTHHMCTKVGSLEYKISMNGRTKIKEA